MANPAQGMPCRVDGTALVMSERSGIEIDYCPTCRGVWLDRGELDKIIERNAQQAAPAPAPAPDYGTPQQASPWGGAPRPPAQNYGHGGDQRHYGQRKRKKSFLEELFGALAARRYPRAMCCRTTQPALVASSAQAASAPNRISADPPAASSR